MTLLRALLVSVSAVLAGCQHAPEPPKDPEPLVARVFLEVKPGEAGVSVSLPDSGVRIDVGPKPVVVEYDLANAEVAQVELGRCLLLQLNGAAARDLYRLSVGAIGRRLVLSLNDRMLGARRIDEPITEGALLFFVEVPDAELPLIVQRLKRTSTDLAMAARKEKR